MVEHNGRQGMYVPSQIAKTGQCASKLSLSSFDLSCKTLVLGCNSTYLI